MNSSESKTVVKIKKIGEVCADVLPFYATKGSAGMDLRASISGDITIKPMDRALIKTGISIELPQGHEAQIRPRSGLALKSGITVLNSPGTIDSDYRGEVGVILVNLGREDFVVQNGMRIAQMIVAKYSRVHIKEVAFLQDSFRRTGGFGSTGA